MILHSRCCGPCKRWVALCCGEGCKKERLALCRGSESFVAPRSFPADRRRRRAGTGLAGRVRGVGGVSRSGPFPIRRRPALLCHRHARSREVGGLCGGRKLADRKSVVEGQSVSVRVEHVGRRVIKKKN